MPITLTYDKSMSLDGFIAEANMRVEAGLGDDGEAHPCLLGGPYPTVGAAPRSSTSCGDGAGAVLEVAQDGEDAAPPRSSARTTSAPHRCSRACRPRRPTRSRTSATSRGIYPPLLADKGLAEALTAQAPKASIPVHVESDGIGRYPQEIESTLYFYCLEALQNVAKYANATRLDVRLSESADELAFEVRDDGAGFARARRSEGAVSRAWPTGSRPWAEGWR